MNVHTNPLCKRYSIGQLVTILHLSRKRVIHLLNNDHLYIDQFGEIACTVLRGPNQYELIKVVENSANKSATLIDNDSTPADEFEPEAIISSDNGRITVTIIDTGKVYKCVNTYQILKSLRDNDIDASAIEWHNVSDKRRLAVMGEL